MQSQYGLLEEYGGQGMKLRVATCQFPVSCNIIQNLNYVQRQMRRAKEKGAHVAHFSEVCLGGYAGVNFDAFHDYDWDLLRQCTEAVMRLARNLRLWVILGSNHRLTGNHKPHNSLYVINDNGAIVDRYDKMFCTGSSEDTDGDLKYYSPGSRLVVFDIKDIRCGLQICHDFRYQELYREYNKLGVQLMLHSYYNGSMTAEKLKDSGNIWGVIVPPTMQTYAANNYMWISVNNTSSRESSWPNFFVRPDGVVTGKLARNKPGILMTTVDTTDTFYDASEAWRERAMEGVYHSGTLVCDRRSGDRTCF